MANNDRFCGCITNDPKTKQKTNQIVTIFVFNESNVVLEMFFIFFRRFEIGHFYSFRFILSLFCPGLYVSCVPVHAIEANKKQAIHACQRGGILFLSSAHPSIENGLILFSKKHL